MTKEDFIQETLRQWGIDLESHLKQAMINANIGFSQELLNSIKTKVEGNAQMQLMFKEYGRMRDMNVGRGRTLDMKGVESMDSNSKIIHKKTEKSSRWYSRTAYGMIDRLIYRLLYNYQEEVASTVKSTLLK